MKIVPRADGKLVLSGTPVVRRTDSRHGNLPEIRDGRTVNARPTVRRAATTWGNVTAAPA